jgi:hypothetical protein
MDAIKARWTGLARRERMIVLALAGVIVVALVYVLFLSGGGGGPEGFSGGPTVTRRSPTPSASATPPAPQTFEVFEGKDPFLPLVAPTMAGTPQPQPSGSPQPSTQPTPGQHVVLEAVFVRNGTRFATVSVNGTEYTVKKGDTFAGNYRVVDLSGQCGTFVFGDERFTLCVGQEVLK